MIEKRLLFKGEAASDKGLRKGVNQDSVYIMVDSGLGIAVMADGMGGYANGEVASRYAIDSIVSWWNNKQDKLNEKSIIPELEFIFQEINNKIISFSIGKGEKIGTTLSVLVLNQSYYYIAHIGDSRIYKISSRDMNDSTVELDDGGKGKTKTLMENSFKNIIQLTEDHSWLASEIKKNNLKEEEARNHPKRHILTQCLGINSDIEVFTQQGFVKVDDVFCLCSDGYYSVFSNQEILNQLNLAKKDKNQWKKVSEILLKNALDNGSTDNISVILITIDDYKNKWYSRLVNKIRLFSSL